MGGNEIATYVNEKNTYLYGENKDEKKAHDYPEYKDCENEQDNIRIFVPIDLNDKAILRRNHCKTGTDT